jgi:hypothetical protein
VLLPKLAVFCRLADTAVETDAGATAISEIDFFSSCQAVTSPKDMLLAFIPMRGTRSTALVSRACSIKSDQYGFTTTDAHRAITNKKCFARVNATFMRRTSDKNPMPRLPAARTAENMTIFASRP